MKYTVVIKDVSIRGSWAKGNGKNLCYLCNFFCKFRIIPKYELFFFSFFFLNPDRRWCPLLRGVQVLLAPMNQSTTILLMVQPEVNILTADGSDDLTLSLVLDKVYVSMLQNFLKIRKILCWCEFFSCGLLPFISWLYLFFLVLQCLYQHYSDSLWWTFLFGIF